MSQLFKSSPSRNEDDVTSIVKDDDDLQPFDWITSASSVQSVLQPIFASVLSSTDRSGIDYALSSSFEELNREYRVLHVGCGSSILGELLIEDYYQKPVTKVVNVDCDRTTLLRMKKRWEQKVIQSQTTNHPLPLLNDAAAPMEFVVVDFTEPNALQQYMAVDINDDRDPLSKTFDLIIDKSTLDCMLCSDTGTVGLLTEVYQYLKDEDGIYLVLSFHPVDFIVPLLQNIPGANWDVTCTTMPRQIEQYNTFNNISDNNNETPTNIQPFSGNSSCQSNVDPPANDGMISDTCTNVDIHDSCSKAYTWSSGTFRPDDRYRNNVTVVQCVRRSSIRNLEDYGMKNQLDWDIVYCHINQVNNKWYQEMNPMLTQDRVEIIERAFNVEASKESIAWNCTTRSLKTKRPMIELLLPQCYTVLFTDGERENLSYDDFLEDWKVFLTKYNTHSIMDDQNKQQLIPDDRMSYRTAIAFLHVMQ